MAKGAPEIDVRTNLIPVLADIKEISPKLYREVRKSLAAAGQTMADAAGKALDSADAAKVVTGTSYRKRGPGEGRRGGYRSGPRARALAGQVIDQITTREANRTRRSSGAIDEVRRGLKLRVPTASGNLTRPAKARFQTTKGDLRRALNMKKFRHPIFNDSGQPPFLEQRGTEYFKVGVTAGGREARERLQDALAEAMAVVKQHNP